MKLLAFVDLHGNSRALKEIKKKSEEADIIICAGDISIFETGLDRLLYQLNEIGKPVLIIPGNHEDDGDLRRLSALFSRISDIHKKSFVKENCLFLGYGGSGFSILDREFISTGKRFERWVKDYKSKEFGGKYYNSDRRYPRRYPNRQKGGGSQKGDTIGDTLQRYNSRKNNSQKIILVTHAPPYKTRLDNIQGEACGNKSIKKFILRLKPDLVISGHLHENAGREDKLGRSILVNPGPFGKLIEV